METSIDTRSVVRSEWIDELAGELDSKFGRHIYRCKNCGTLAHSFVGGTEDWWDIDKPKFCHECGAIMVNAQ